MAGREPDLLWLDLRDAARAFACALRRDTSEGVRWTDRWGLFHIAAPLPDGKFSIDAARRMGYEPRHGFACCYED